MHEVHAGPILRIARPGSLRGRPHRGAAVWQVKCQAKNFTLDFGENTVDRETTSPRLDTRPVYSSTWTKRSEPGTSRGYCRRSCSNRPPKKGCGPEFDGNLAGRWQLGFQA
jgi:hypothetical protein